MRRSTLTMLAATALAATLAACGGAGTAATDATVDEPAEVEGAATDEKVDEGDAEEVDGKADEKADEEVDEKADEKIGKAAGKAVADAISEAEREAAVEAAEAEGKTVLVGKVVMVDGPDIFRYESIDPEALGGAGHEEGNTYAILELDGDTTISGMGADNYPRTETHDHIGLGHDLPRYAEIKDTASQWAQYDGMRVCVAGDAVFPTDVSFPTAGTLHDAEVLYVEG